MGMKNKTYVVAVSDYMGEGPIQYATKHPNLRSLLMELLDYDDDGETVEELQKEFTRSNGDGQPYLTVFCVEQNKQVLG